jgi:hypothetical protein
LQSCTWVLRFALQFVSGIFNWFLGCLAILADACVHGMCRGTVLLSYETDLGVLRRLSCLSRSWRELGCPLQRVGFLPAGTAVTVTWTAAPLLATNNFRDDPYSYQSALFTNYSLPPRLEILLGTAHPPMTTIRGSIFITIMSSHINISPLQGISHLLAARKTPWKVQFVATDEKSSSSVT